jgi:hypothetical protein
VRAGIRKEIRMARAERREISLAPQDVEFTESGELVVRSDRLEETMRLARAERGRLPDTEALEITISITIKF